MTQPPDSKVIFRVCLGPGAAAVAVYLPVRKNDLSTSTILCMLPENQKHIQKGITPEALKWAFTTNQRITGTL